LGEEKRKRGLNSKKVIITGRHGKFTIVENIRESKKKSQLGLGLLLGPHQAVAQKETDSLVRDERRDGIGGNCFFWSS